MRMGNGGMEIRKGKGRELIRCSLSYTPTFCSKRLFGYGVRNRRWKACRCSRRG